MRLPLKCPACGSTQMFELALNHGHYSASCPRCKKTVWFTKERVMDKLEIDNGNGKAEPLPPPSVTISRRDKAWIAAEAARLVSGDRNSQHGDPLDNHQRVAAIWTSILGMKSPILPLSALDVANMMEALKIARRYSGGHNLDDYVDGAGYAAVAGDIAERLHGQKS